MCVSDWRIDATWKWHWYTCKSLSRLSEPLKIWLQLLKRPARCCEMWQSLRITAEYFYNIYVHVCMVFLGNSQRHLPTALLDLFEDSFKGLYTHHPNISMECVQYKWFILVSFSCLDIRSYWQMWPFARIHWSYRPCTTFFNKSPAWFCIEWSLPPLW